MLGIVLVSDADAELMRIIAQGFDEGPRSGKSVDEPEGSRYILISDTLAKKLAATLRRIAAGQNPSSADSPGTSVM